MRPFSLRLFSPAVAPDGILVASRDDWPGRVVIFPRAQTGKVKGRKGYLQSGIYLLVSSKRMYIFPFSYMALREWCELGVITETREGLMFAKELFFSSGSTATAVARGAIINADWWESSLGKSLGDYIHETKAKT